MDFDSKESGGRRSEMDRNSQGSEPCLYDILLEAIKNNKFWKNLLFIVILLALVLVQGSFCVMISPGKMITRLGPAGDEMHGS